jgi:hypothetical protein
MIDQAVTSGRRGESSTTCKDNQQNNRYYREPLELAFRDAWSDIEWKSAEIEKWQTPQGKKSYSGQENDDKRTPVKKRSDSQQEYKMGNQPKAEAKAD